MHQWTDVFDMTVPKLATKSLTGTRTSEKYRHCQRCGPIIGVITCALLLCSSIVYSAQCLMTTRTEDAPFTDIQSISRIFNHDHLDRIEASSNASTQQKTIKDMIARYFPSRADEFVVTVDPGYGPAGVDSYSYVTDSAGKLLINGSSGVAVASGLYSYLKEFGNCELSWFEWQTTLLKPLPPVKQMRTVSAQDKFHYNSNVCTFGYSYVWWNWSRWEREIDWMAMNGVNIPLAFTGQEAIYQKVFLSLGVTQSELDEWFSGPAFLAWWRMGNLLKWGGPLSQAYIDGQKSLQKAIIHRMRDFGMTPILPAFAGHVPKAILRLYPDIDVSYLSPWSHFDCNYTCTLYLSPTDPLYRNISSRFITEMLAEYGTDHFYNIDPWNEMTPSNSTLPYLALASADILASLTVVDPQAVWVMQGWMFAHNADYWTNDKAKALLTGVPKGRMLVLDLAAEYEPMYIKLNFFYGQPFIWCMINNFGGRLGIYGHIRNVNKNIIFARHNSTSMVGTGLTMEGTGTNYILYELMNEMHWRNSSVNLTTWTQEYTNRRYRLTYPELGAAWLALADTALNSSHFGQQILIKRPTLHMPDYNVSGVKSAVTDMMKVVLLSPSSVRNSSLFLYDLVTLWREVLVNKLCLLYTNVKPSYDRKNVTSIRFIAENWSAVLSDLELLLGSDEHFLLGNWLAEAESLATNEHDRLQFRQNALNQITLWGPNGEIHDYAGKQWSGLVSDYYKPRWDLFFQQIIEALEKDVQFNEDLFKVEVLETVEKPFSISNTTYQTYTEGDTVMISSYLFWTYFG